MTTKAIQKSNIVPLHPLSAQEALAWLSERAPVPMPASQLARLWKWPPRKAQRQVATWIKDGVVRRKGRTNSVVALPEPPEPAAVSQTATAPSAANDNANDRPWARLLLTLAVLLPVGGLNVWPRVAQLLAGTTDQSGWSLVAFQALALIVMSQVPFALSRVQSWSARVVLTAFAALLIATNLTFSVEAIGTIRDAARDHNRQIAANIAALTRDLDETRRRAA